MKNDQDILLSLKNVGKLSNTCATITDFRTFSERYFLNNTKDILAQKSGGYTTSIKSIFGAGYDSQ